MKVGIKYCGGCNPLYRREEVEDVLRKAFPEARFFYISSGGLGNLKADVVVCISGCKRGCAVESIDSMIPTTQNSGGTVRTIISVDERRDRENLVAEFKRVLERPW